MRLVESAANVGERAVAKYGYSAQELMIVEECGELLTALARVHRGRDHDSAVVEEAADVLIVVLQIGLHLDAERFLEILAAKTCRLSERVGT